LIRNRRGGHDAQHIGDRRQRQRKRVTAAASERLYQKGNSAAASWITNPIRVEADMNGILVCLCMDRTAAFTTGANAKRTVGYEFARVACDRSLIMVDMTAADESSSPALGTHAGEATLVLHRLVSGESSAANELLPLVYEQLRALAGSYFRGQPGDHTLQPTALVHEAYIKLINPDSVADKNYRGRAHFMAVAATAMRQILQDRARRKRAAKHGGELERVTLDGVHTPSDQSIVDMVALDDALSRLAEADPRAARIVELRFFGGLTNDEVAQVLELSTRMIEKEWRRTRAWLSVQLAESATP
jgi:RNA polymerase sigma factor (TIGR02999 family)